MRVNYVPEKRECIRGENALRRVDGYTEFFESAEDHADVLGVLFSVPGRNEDVVDVRENEVEASENSVY